MRGGLPQAHARSEGVLSAAVARRQRPGTGSIGTTELHHNAR